MEQYIRIIQAIHTPYLHSKFLDNHQVLYKYGEDSEKHFGLKRKKIDW